MRSLSANAGKVVSLEQFAKRCNLARLASEEPVIAWFLPMGRIGPTKRQRDHVYLIRRTIPWNWNN